MKTKHHPSCCRLNSVLVFCSVVTCGQIAGLFVGNMTELRAIIYKHHFFSFFHPLDALVDVLSNCAMLLNPAPNLSVLFFLTCLEKLVSTS